MARNLRSRFNQTMEKRNVLATAASVKVSDCVGWIGNYENKCYHLIDILRVDGTRTTGKLPAIDIMKQYEFDLNDEQYVDLWSHITKRGERTYR